MTIIQDEWLDEPCGCSEMHTCIRHSLAMTDRYERDRGVERRALTVTTDWGTVPAWAEAHDHRTAHGVPVRVWYARRGRVGGHVETACEQDGSRTPYPSEGRALSVAAGQEPPAWCWL